MSNHISPLDREHWCAESPRQFIDNICRLLHRDIGMVNLLVKLQQRFNLRLHLFRCVWRTWHGRDVSVIVDRANLSTTVNSIKDSYCCTAISFGHVHRREEVHHLHGPFMRRPVHVSQIVENVFGQINRRVGVPVEEAYVDQTATKGDNKVLAQGAASVAGQPQLVQKPLTELVLEQC